MIDIETMGTHTSLSLILSVGAWAFELRKDYPEFKDTSFLKVLSMEPQILKGRRIERDTQKWWSEQDPKAREHWESVSEKIHPSYLEHFLKDYLAMAGVAEKTLIWANGIVFDLGNLENLLLTYDYGPLPWKYNVTRDARTIYQLPKKREMPSDLTFVGHDPIEDCKKQIWRLWEHAPEEWLE